MKITLTVPDTSLSITKELPDDFGRSLCVAAAIKWYELGRISQSKAAELIGCSRTELFDHFRAYAAPFVQLEPADLDRELADRRI